jgi:hypothetical protein
MMYPTSTTVQLDIPAHIWTQLASDHQLRAIRLMAQLACNLAAVQSVPSPQEAPHALRPQQH